MAEPVKEIDIFAPLEDDGWNTDERCPFCQEHIDDLYEYEAAPGDPKAIECPHCDKAIVLEPWLQYILKKPPAVSGEGSS